MSSNLDATKEETEEFLSHLLYYEENFVRNIAVLEDTTIKYNYPYQGNESSIGVDLGLVDDQKEQVLHVKESLSSVFIGPVTLVQGGQAFIIRIPIVDDNTDYWGQLSFVIDYDVLYETIEEDVNANGLSVLIQDSSTGDVVMSVGEVDDSRYVTTEYQNQYFTWDIIASKDNYQSNLLLGLATRAVSLSLITILVYFTYRSKVLDWELKYYADHDYLTNDLNRTKFYSDYNDGLFHGMLIAFVDINKFKLINDTLGHSFGDWVLTQVSNSYKQSGKFKVYRLSGDEFVLVSNEPMTAAEFQTILQPSDFIYYNDDIKQDIEVKVSMGVLEQLPKTINLETILMYLDYAMYDAKEVNTMYNIVTDDLMELYNETKVIEQQIIEDVRNNNLIPYYQPIINVEDGTVDGFEVLSRWKYKGTIQSATMFIDILKKIRYVDIIDQNLFNQIQEEYEELSFQSDKIKDCTFSFNLSAETLMSMERDNKMFDVFVQHRKIPIENIIFEISEDMNLGLISIDTLRYIQQKGYNITVDDFGSGVSKLSDVLSGELKRIKTDKTLLPSSDSKDKRTKGFHTVVQAIKASGSTICAEGVETVEQLEMSIDAGCRLVQGYLFAKPFGKEQVIEFIETFDYSEYTK
jgi:diguanylate cyclase (GGDEF)-like protein